MKATVATEEKAIVTLVRSAGPRVHVAFEEGTQAQWLHDLLLGHAERVVVCNVRGRDALRNANDRSTPGVSVYRASQRKQWLAKREGGTRVRAESLLSQLDVLSELRPKARAAMIEAARRQPRWKVLRTIPFLGPVRVAYLLAIMRTPWRFRTKRNLWPYAGLAVVRQSSADQEFRDGKLQRSRKASQQGRSARQQSRRGTRLTTS